MGLLLGGAVGFSRLALDLRLISARRRTASSFGLNGMVK